jgi:methylenetetrahydrofolate reductase (NADPH)
MKVIEHLEQREKPISFEIIPPLRGNSLEKLEKVIQTLAKYNPPFIDVTSHSAKEEFLYEEDGIRRILRKKRPGTLGICAIIKHKYNIDSVPHILCHGFTREETEDILIELNYIGINNVLALRGDKTGFNKPTPRGKTKNQYASDLIKQIQDMNQGKLINQDSKPTDFCIGVASYPEKHFEAPNLKRDIEYLKQKIDAGANYIVTQMFFNNKKYFRFLDECKKQNITVPIIPGLKIITKKSHLTFLPKTFHCEIPYELSTQIEEATTKQDIQKIGINWALNQTKELFEQGSPALHFYVMGSSTTIEQFMQQHQSLKKRKN